MAKKANTKSSKNLSRGVFSRTKIYTFELLMSIIGLLVTTFVVDYGIFSIFNYITDTSRLRYDSSGLIIFILAAMIVWLPVAILFYLRTRGEMDARGKLASVGIQKVLVALFMFINIIAAIGALFYAVYMLLQYIVGTSDSSVNAVIRYVIPGVLVAFWHGWLFSAFSNIRYATRKLFATVVSAVTIIVIVTLFVLTASSIRVQAADSSKTADLSELSVEIERYNREQEQLPRTLRDIDAPSLINSLDSYTYKRVSDTRYKLCAEFSEASQTRYGANSYQPINDYTAYPNWSHHGSGEHCFKVELRKDNRFERQTLPEAAL